MQRLADLIINDLFSDELTTQKLQLLGRVDSAFYIDKLPADLRQFAAGLPSATISSSKLLQRFFAPDFQKNLGWTGARALYANFRQGDILKSSSGPANRPDDNDFELKQAEMERMEGAAEVIVRTLIGYPPTIDSSPLPKSLFPFLIACDQRLHARLLNDTSKGPYSTDQIRTARLALLTNLIATRLLQPMLSSLAAPMTSPTEMCFLTLLMKGLIGGVEQLSTAFFNKSFANSPHALQQQAMEKLNQEKISERIRRLQSKPTVRHIRTRSADTEPISPRTLRTIEEARTLHKLQKTGELARTLEAQDWSALDEANRTINSNLAMARAREDHGQFESDDLEMLVKALLGERDANVFPLTPRRAQRLDDSDEELAATLVANDGATQGAPVLTTTANPFTTTTTTTAPTTTTTPVSKEKRPGT